jgi:hypothetical protein
MKTHPLNVSYLVVGLIFLGLAGSWALRETGIVDLGEIRWLFPLTLVVAGVIGLVAFAAKGIGRRPKDEPYDVTGNDAYDPYDTYHQGDDR